MPHQAFTIPITDVVDILGLERNPRDRAGASSFNVRCPFCDPPGKHYHMNINTEMNVYFCPRCMDTYTQKNTGALDLYGQVRLGTPLIPGVNGKYIYHTLMCELESKTPNYNSVRSIPVEVEEIYPAANSDLDKVYRALLSLPSLALTRRHGSNLVQRGLDRNAILQGGYASLRPADSLIKMHPNARKVYEWYNSHNIGRVKANSNALKYYTKSEIIAGLLLANDLIKLGLSLERIPGFFKLEGRWCFRYDQGMLIPTVALDGNIVGMQVRRDVTTKAGLRYMTVSSKGLEGGVTTRIARTHVVKNGPIDANTTVFVTEGPLKANVIVHLMSKRSNAAVAVVAVQGVTNTKELPEIARSLYESGVRSVYSALDMDKTGNMSVAQAGRTMKKIFAEKGINMVPLCWDKEYAEIKYAELADICKSHDLPVPETDNVFDDIFTMAKDLSSRSIDYNVYVVNGKEYKNHWRDETKGLDDYLLFRSTIGKE